MIGASYAVVLSTDTRDDVRHHVALVDTRDAGDQATEVGPVGSRDVPT
jgi:hypothetical protein